MRFFHLVDNVIFLDGDDVRLAPMAAALFRSFAARDPLLRLWRTKVSSAGSGKFTLAGAPPDKKAKQAALSLGLDISSHAAQPLTQPLIETSSIVLGIEPKHVEYVRDHGCKDYPAYADRIITLFDYLLASDLKFDSLIGSNNLSDYTSFAEWLELLLPRLVYRFQEDTYLPLLARGKGLGSAIVQGAARIAKNASQAQDILAGDVIVSDTNSIIGALGRAKLGLARAIVTDSSSEMSELSELSHELNIPCIGGTGNGTEMIHDGQQVLVDSTGGFVYGVN